MKCETCGNEIQREIVNETDEYILERWIKLYTDELDDIENAALRIYKEAHVIGFQKGREHPTLITSARTLRADEEFCERLAVEECDTHQVDGYKYDLESYRKMPAKEQQYWKDKIREQLRNAARDCSQGSQYARKPSASGGIKEAKE